MNFGNIPSSNKIHALPDYITSTSHDLTTSSLHIYRMNFYYIRQTAITILWGQCNLTLFWMSPIGNSLSFPCRRWVFLSLMSSKLAPFWSLTWVFLSLICFFLSLKRYIVTNWGILSLTGVFFTQPFKVMQRCRFFNCCIKTDMQLCLFQEELQ